MNEADLVAVLQILTHRLKRNLHLDPQCGELIRRAYSRQHEELRRIEGAPGEDHLACRSDAPRYTRFLSCVWRRAI